MPALFFPVTIFLSAFLLFQVQPILGRFVLPVFGGGPAVWTSCMLFFQTVLLAGYAYAHWVGSRKNPRTQTWIHLGVLAVSCAFLPITPTMNAWRSAGSGDPTGQILFMLALAVGGPYLVLSSTAPLLQRWFHVTRPDDSPWGLYALSNAGSFLALLSYPFLIEPMLRLRTQTLVWSILFVVFAALCAWVAWNVGKTATAAAAESRASTEDDEAPRTVDIVLWIALAACASVVLLGTTNQVSQEVAVIPFLWVAPLALYLLSFVLTFASGHWYPRTAVAILAGILAPVSCAVLTASVAVPILLQLLTYLGTLFVLCMLCHGELVRLRPTEKHLTMFYLAVSFGGALGGGLAALAAPRIFSDYVEFPLSLALACLLGVLCWLRAGALREWTSRNFAVRIPMMAMLLGAATSLASGALSQSPGIDHRRNFYGVLRVSERTVDYHTQRLLTHGRTQHGTQFMDGENKNRATTYYGSHSGVAIGITSLPRPRRVAVVGLGAGTIAAWGREGDNYTFYEINPDVEAIARQWFTYLQDSKAMTSVVLGDARIELRRELESGRKHDYDFIAVDAFSSDSIPIHLLTSEAGDLYRERLAPGGILALHISNRSINLEPVTRGLAKHLGWHARMMISLPDLKTGESGSRWVLMTEKRENFEDTNIRDTILGWSSPSQPVVTWTDDFSSLWPLIR
ncbi:MAG: fused MFS/spermidine synthase [Bryobacteraceae bacterium]